MAMSNYSSAGLKPHNRSRDDLTASIIIVTCSGRRYLEGCLSSVAAELWPGCELIVVDDGYTDLTAHVSQSAGAVVVQHEHNQGKSAVLNSGSQVARENQAGAAVTLDAYGQHRPEDLFTVYEEKPMVWSRKCCSKPPNGERIDYPEEVFFGCLLDRNLSFSVFIGTNI